METASSVAQPVGKNEVAMAFSTLVSHYIGAAGPWPAAIDITTEVAFPWPRWLRNLAQNREIVRSGISKVFIKQRGPATTSLAVLVGPTIHMSRSTYRRPGPVAMGSSGAQTAS